jgi:hypothetical protein
MSNKTDRNFKNPCGFQENRAIFTSTNFADRVASILNSILTKNLEIDSSFFQKIISIF